MISYLHAWYLLIALRCLVCVVAYQKTRDPVARTYVTCIVILARRRFLFDSSLSRLILVVIVQRFMWNSNEKSDMHTKFLPLSK